MQEPFAVVDREDSDAIHRSYQVFFESLAFEDDGQQVVNGSDAIAGYKIHLRESVREFDRLAVEKDVVPIYHQVGEVSEYKVRGFRANMLLCVGYIAVNNKPDFHHFLCRRVPVGGDDLS